MPVIADLSTNEAPRAYSRKRASVKESPLAEAAAGSGAVSIIRCVCSCCGRPISLRIGRPYAPAVAAAAAPRFAFTPEAERLVSGRGRVALDDLFSRPMRESARRVFTDNFSPRGGSAA